jgi:hypothetical protein
LVSSAIRLSITSTASFRGYILSWAAKDRQISLVRSSRKIKWIPDQVRNDCVSGFGFLVALLPSELPDPE